MKTSLNFIFLFCFAINSFAQFGKIIPNDTSAQDPSLVEFLEQLKVAVQSKNKAFIQEHLATTLYTPYEGGEQVSPQKFMKYYFSESSNESSLWSNFNAIFKIGGGGFGKDAHKYCIPYTSGNIKENDEKCGLGLVVAKTDHVKVYSSSDNNATIIDTLSYDVVAIPYDDFVQKYNWLKIKLADNKVGYVHEDEIYYTLSVRAGFIKENGLWKIQYADYYD